MSGEFVLLCPSLKIDEMLGLNGLEIAFYCYIYQSQFAVTRVLLFNFTASVSIL